MPARLPGLVVNVFYLHGFASSPASTKVGYFTDRFGERGIDLRCPDLNQPDFARMTLAARCRSFTIRGFIGLTS